jgi:uncharacterized protein (DUF305 family)
MINLKRAALGASLMALVAGCGGAGTNETANSSNVQQPAGNESAQAMPSGPFSQVDMQMNERMMAASGANASETWARKMIEHHRGAIEMSRILIEQGGDPQFVQMARQGSEKQQREITELERMVAGGISGGSGEANPYREAEQQMHQQMMATSGASLTETWARKMIAHHRGAVAMSEILIRQGGDPEVVALARRVVTDQRREAEHLEAMLRGEGMPAAGAAAATAPAAAPVNGAPRERAAPVARQPNAAPKAAPPRRAEQPRQATPRPAPRAEPSPPQKAECLPEHRAAGHC